MLIIILLIVIFLLNYLLYLIISFKIKNEENRIKISYLKLYPKISAICLVLIPIINSSFLQILFPENISYFKEYWLWFVLVGIIFIILGIKFLSMVKKIKPNKSKFESTGPYKIVRHPKDTGWILLFLGLACILDSFISVIISPIFIFLLELKDYLEEKFILIPKYGKDYEKFKEKTPYRLISSPYNALMIIIAILIAYIGIFNIF